MTWIVSLISKTTISFNDCFTSSCDVFMCKNILNSSEAYVVASYDRRFFSTVSYKFGQLARILGVNGLPPPRQKIAHTPAMYEHC